MNHDYAHCLDFCDDCPKECFRAKLVREMWMYGNLAPYVFNRPISWMHLKGTEECKRKKIGVTE